MTKIKINCLSSHEYEGGRIDRFSFEEEQNIHANMIGMISELGMEDKNLLELDRVTPEFDGYLFVFGKNMKIHVFSNKKDTTFLIDSNIPREKIISAMDKYFEYQ